MALAVIREQLGLVPVEYPTTRQLNAPPEDRARDLMEAFRDDSVSAVMATIGGSDQITVLPHLDPAVFVEHPKRFFGYSDNTNLLNFLYNQGVVGYHGGSTFVHLARAGGVHPVSLESIRAALFTNDTVEIAPVQRFTDLEPDWNDPTTLSLALDETSEPGWYWHQGDRVVTGPSWGGNLEILHWNLAANRWILPPDCYAGGVLILETSEEMPDDEEVFRMLRNFGERGMLAQFPAVVFAKAKAARGGTPRSDEARAAFRLAQRDAVLRAVATYNPDAVVVIGPDFGHTDPQYVLPYGGRICVDGPAKRITVTY